VATIERYQTSGGATLYRVRYRKPDRGQTQKRGFKTKREAEAFAASVEVSKLKGEYVAPSHSRVTVAELGPAWLDRQRGHLKPSGFRSYESTWRVTSRRGGAALLLVTSGRLRCSSGYRTPGVASSRSGRAW
jgi:hypothetical protein